MYTYTKNAHADEVADRVVFAQDSELAGIGDLGVFLVRHLLSALGEQVCVAAVRRVHVTSRDGMYGDIAR